MYGFTKIVVELVSEVNLVRNISKVEVITPLTSRSIQHCPGHGVKVKSVLAFGNTVVQ